MQSPAGNLIFLALLFVVFYFFLIRPQKKRMDAQRQLIMSLEEGDEVVTAGGIVGTINTLEEDTMLLEVAPGTNIRVLRSAVGRKLTEDLDEDEYEEEEEAEAEAEEVDEVGDLGEEDKRA
jgi:preprotein translocase subunit YajC